MYTSPLTAGNLVGAHELIIALDTSGGGACAHSSDALLAHQENQETE